eukprot:m.79300 g.79300  ORF g.79300 m.79300 type:complete len:738 (-) comp12708_c0_seq1:87-2300(-)
MSASKRPPPDAHAMRQPPKKQRMVSAAGGSGRALDMNEGINIVVLKRQNNSLAIRLKKYKDDIDEKDDLLRVYQSERDAKIHSMGLLSLYWGQLDSAIRQYLPEENSQGDGESSFFSSLLQDTVKDCEEKVKKHYEESIKLMKDVVQYLKKSQSSDSDSKVAEERKISAKLRQELTVAKICSEKQKISITEAEDAQSKMRKEIERLTFEVEKARIKASREKGKAESAMASIQAAEASAAAATESNLKRESSEAGSAADVDGRVKTLQEVADARLKEIATLRSEIEQLRLSESKLRTQASNGSNEPADVTKSTQFLSIASELQRERKQALEEREKFKRDMSEIQKLLDAKSLEVRHFQTLDAERNTKLNKTLDGFKDEFASLKAERDKAKMAVEAMKAGGETKKLLMESKKLTSSLMAEKGRLAAELARLRKELEAKREAGEIVGDADMKMLQVKIEQGTLTPAETETHLKSVVQQAVEQWKIIESNKDNEAVLIQEIDETGQSLEEAQDRNASLLQQLQDKDEAVFEVMAQKRRADAACKLAMDKARLEKDNLKVLQDEVAKLTALGESLRENDRLHVEANWNLERKLKEKEQQLEAEKQAKDALERDLKDLTQKKDDFSNKMSKFNSELESRVKAASQAESDLRRLEEKHKSLQRELKNKSFAASGDDNGMMMHIKHLNKKIQCASCNLRPKDAVITKCWHAHCEECIKKTFEVRSRKCPTCNESFTMKEWHKIYM